MRSKYSLVVLILFSFSFSFCSQENKREGIADAVASERIKEQKDTSSGKCCASNIPARFPIKNKNIPQPEKSK